MRCTLDAALTAHAAPASPAHTQHIHLSPHSDTLSLDTHTTYGTHPAVHSSHTYAPTGRVAQHPKKPPPPLSTTGLFTGAVAAFSAGTYSFGFGATRRSLSTAASVVPRARLSSSWPAVARTAQSAGQARSRLSTARPRDGQRDWPIQVSRARTGSGIDPVDLEQDVADIDVRLRGGALRVDVLNKGQIGVLLLH